MMRSREWRLGPFARLRGRAFVVPEDVKAVAPATLRHRVLVTYEAEAQDMTSYDVVAALLAGVAVP